VVTATTSIVQSLRPHLIASAQLPAYAHFIQKLYGARAKKLGWSARPGDDQDTRLLRAELLSLVSDYGGDTQLRAEATRLARAWLKDRKAIAPDLTRAVLDTAAHDGDVALYDAFLAEAQRADRRDRERLIGALGAFRNPALVKRTLALVLDERFDPREIDGLPHETMFWETGRAPTWDFVRANFDAIAKRISAETAAYYVWLPTSFCDEPHRAEAEAFFTPRVAALPGGPRVLTQALESANLCVKFTAAQSASVASFLKAY